MRAPSWVLLGHQAGQPPLPQFATSIGDLYDLLEPFDIKFCMVAAADEDPTGAASRIEWLGDTSIHTESRSFRSKIRKSYSERMLSITQRQVVQLTSEIKTMLGPG